MNPMKLSWQNFQIFKLERITKMTVIVWSDFIRAGKKIKTCIWFFKWPPHLFWRKLWVASNCGKTKSGLCSRTAVELCNGWMRSCRFRIWTSNPVTSWNAEIDTSLPIPLARLKCSRKSWDLKMERKSYECTSAMLLQKSCRTIVGCKVLICWELICTLWASAFWKISPRLLCISLTWNEFVGILKSTCEGILMLFGRLSWKWSP